MFMKVGKKIVLDAQFSMW